uniref:RNase H domain-containing protein n=1 Tax=Heterorhabditis bacteriophora TaxID=37862 RepID=A0A1I7XF30_HETBA
MSIPRLELTAITLAIRLAKEIMDATQSETTRVNIISDSTIALSWLKSTRRLPIFITDQVDRIKKAKQCLEAITARVQFSHVPTEYNVADIGTRGIHVKLLQQSEWLQGPTWLRKEQCTWPIKSINEIDDMNIKEITVSDKPICSLNQVTETTPNLIDINRFSNYTKLLRVVARTGKMMKLWTKNLENIDQRHGLNEIKMFTSKEYINAADIEVAERMIIKQEQNSTNLIGVQKRYPNKVIFKDEHGLVRCDSRILNACIPRDAKQPKKIKVS